MKGHTVLIRGLIKPSDITGLLNRHVMQLRRHRNFELGTQVSFRSICCSFLHVYHLMVGVQN